MLFRYWGERGVHAEDFSHLVSDPERGIPAADLTAEVRGLGWSAHPFRGSPRSVRDHLERGRPVMALVRVRPRRYHYVVVTAWTEGTVLYHDPAVGPYRLADAREWKERWEAADRWALLVLPAGSGEGDEGRQEGGGVGDAARPSRADGAGSGEPCGDLVRQGVDRARRGEDRAAEEALRAASRLCPSSGSAVAELAALRLSGGDPSAAASLAERAVEREPDLAYGWKVLGTARFVSGEPLGALEAWNRVDEPSVDLVEVVGGRGIPYRAAHRAASLPPGVLLTPGRLRRAERRLSALPAAAGARVRYRPVREGRAEVTAALRSRRAPGLDLPTAVGLLAKAADRELRVEVPSLVGRGELWEVGWRWEERRPRVRLEVAFPAPGGAVWRAEARRGSQAYGTAGPSGSVVEDGRRLRLAAGQWVAGGLRWEARAGVERWRAGTEAFADRPFIGAALEWRGPGDRAALLAEGTAWTPGGGGAPPLKGRAAARWRAGGPEAAGSVEARAEGTAVGGEPPLAAWPGAGTGRARGAFLRAHPLLEEGVVEGPAFGRRLVAVTMEATGWIVRPGPARIGIAAFADAARAWARSRTAAAGSGRAPLHVDAGAGLRLSPGAGGGTVRLDAALGLRDGEAAVSVGWSEPWPAWR